MPSALWYLTYLSDLTCPKLNLIFNASSTCAFTISLLPSVFQPKNLIVILKTCGTLPLPSNAVTVQQQVLLPTNAKYVSNLSPFLYLLCCHVQTIIATTYTPVVFPSLLSPCNLFSMQKPKRPKKKEKKSKLDHIISLPESSEWLPTAFMIKYKLLAMACNTPHDLN